jgi:hypothetical protein
MTPPTQPLPSTRAASWRWWLDPPALAAGSGLLGALCCIAGAIAVGSGLGALSVLGTLMDRYQPFFIALSVLAMTWWLLRTVRAQRHGMAGRSGRGDLAGPLRRATAGAAGGADGAASAGTLLLTMAISRVLRAG